MMRTGAPTGRPGKPFETPRSLTTAQKAIAG